jgi:hypothetical protein
MIASTIETAIFPRGMFRRPDDLPSKVTCSRLKDDLQKVRLQCLLFAMGDMGDMGDMGA